MYRAALQERLLSHEGLVVGSLLAFLAVPFIWVIGLRLCARTGPNVLRDDQRMPFLYLRSFTSDAPEADFVWPLPVYSYERQLATALSDIGPLVAIGAPGELLPPLGAVRLYVNDDSQWKDMVSKSMVAARAVFFLIGKTEGFWWELKHAVSNCDPRKIIICLPKKNRREMYAYLREKASDIFPHPLPADLGTAMFLAFGSTWVPYLLAPRYLHLLRPIVSSGSSKMRDALNDALAQVGVPRGEMPYLFRELIAAFGLLDFCGRALCLVPFFSLKLPHGQSGDIINSF
jgi:hypothetical protein